MRCTEWYGIRGDLFLLHFALCLMSHNLGALTELSYLTTYHEIQSPLHK